MVEAASALLTENIDVAVLVQELDASISELEAGHTRMALRRKSGAFDAVFDLLMKFKMLRNPTGKASSPLSENLRMAHFAKRSTESLIGLGTSVKSSYEQVIGDLWNYPAVDGGFKGPASILNGKIAMETLSARFIANLPYDLMNTDEGVSSYVAKETAISQLQELETEIQELSKQFALHTSEITSDRIRQLNTLLRAKLNQVLSSLSPVFYAYIDFASSSLSTKTATMASAMHQPSSPLMSARAKISKISRPAFSLRKLAICKELPANTLSQSWTPYRRSLRHLTTNVSAPVERHGFTTHLHALNYTSPTLPSTRP